MMRRTFTTIFVLLGSACVAATSAQADVATQVKAKKSSVSSNTEYYHASAKTKKSPASAKAKQAIAAANTKNSSPPSAKVKQAIAAAKVKDPDSLYDAGNAAYVAKSRSLFDFGPKSQTIKYDKRMIMAAEIAAERAHKHSTMRCWMYVKNALVSAQVISSRPTTGYAKQAGEELQSKYGFKKLPIQDPYEAPLGSVLVYGGRGAGHVEIRTAQGFVSDFTTSRPSRRPLIGVYVKPS